MQRTPERPLAGDRLQKLGGVHGECPTPTTSKEVLSPLSTPLCPASGEDCSLYQACDGYPSHLQTPRLRAGISTTGGQMSDPRAAHLRDRSPGMQFSPDYLPPLYTPQASARPGARQFPAQDPSPDVRLWHDSPKFSQSCHVANLPDIRDPPLQKEVFPDQSKGETNNPSQQTIPESVPCGIRPAASLEQQRLSAEAQGRIPRDLDEYPENFADHHLGSTTVDQRVRHDYQLARAKEAALPESGTRNNDFSNAVDARLSGAAAGAAFLPNGNVKVQPSEEAGVVLMGPLWRGPGEIGLAPSVAATPSARGGHDRDGCVSATPPMTESSEPLQMTRESSARTRHPASTHVELLEKVHTHERSYLKQLLSSHGDGARDSPIREAIPKLKGSADHSSIIPAQDFTPPGTTLSQSVIPPATPGDDKSALVASFSYPPSRQNAATAGRWAKRCNCKKSKCLKLYCDCFAAGQFCGCCTCQNCQNSSQYKELVDSTRTSIEQRNPQAFSEKISKITHSAIHRRGCNCKKSNCKKKYCECYQAGVNCGPQCKCVACHNTPSDGMPPAFNGDAYRSRGSKARGQLAPYTSAPGTPAASRGVPVGNATTTAHSPRVPRISARNKAKREATSSDQPSPGLLSDDATPSSKAADLQSFISNTYQKEVEAAASQSFPQHVPAQESAPETGTQRDRAPQEHPEDAGAIFHKSMVSAEANLLKMLAQDEHKNLNPAPVRGSTCRPVCSPTALSQSRSVQGILGQPDGLGLLIGLDRAGSGIKETATAQLMWSQMMESTYFGRERDVNTSLASRIPASELHFEGSELARQNAVIPKKGILGQADISSGIKRAATFPLPSRAENNCSQNGQDDFCKATPVRSSVSPSIDRENRSGLANIKQVFALDSRPLQEYNTSILSPLHLTEAVPLGRPVGLDDRPYKRSAAHCDVFTPLQEKRVLRKVASPSSCDQMEGHNRDLDLCVRLDVKKEE